MLHQTPVGPVHCLSRIAFALLLTSAAAPALAAAATGAATSGAAAAADGQPATDQSQQEIIVNAPPLFRDIQPERTLDQDAIESYGVSTIDELLAEVQVDLGAEGEEPLIFVNGKQINDLSEIGALPVEALRSLQVLPRGTAVRAGGSPGQRVISLTLKRSVQSATLTAAHKVSTDGHWNADRGEAILTKVKGSTRANIALRVRDESDLFESERAIIQPTPFLPYALTGNVIGYPNTTGEIDPLLSAIAGETVTVAPVPPGQANPTLASFAAGANTATFTNLGPYRTLRPQTRNYDLNGSFNSDIAPWLTANATVDLQQNVSRGLRGLPAALLILAPTNPASPFSRSVGLAYYGSDPLHYRSTHHGGNANLTLDATFGKWTGNLHLEHSESKDVYASDQQTTFGFIPLPDNVDPFTTDISSLIGTTTSQSSSRSLITAADLLLNGPSVVLPAGPVQATVEGRVGSSSLRSQSSFGPFGNAAAHRSGQSIRGAIDVPIANSDANVLAPLGHADVSAEYSLNHFSDAGTMSHYALGLNWFPTQRLQIGSNLSRTELPPDILLLGSPTVVTQSVRVFDPLTGETVDIVQITGGNPTLKPETDRIFRINGILRLVQRLNLQLNAEYTQTSRKNFVSTLPEASAAVMLAFPNRFVRDASGTLVTEDLRPVNFDSEEDKRLRWGISMNTRLGSSPVPGQRPTGPIKPRTYFQLTFNHTMVFSDKIFIRSGLPPVDLLSGGAIGISGGRLRHQLDASAAITSGGTGARIAMTYRGASELHSVVNGTADTLHFSPVLALNARVFTDLKRFLPRSSWARGLRVSLDLLNVANRHQRVADSFGNTPLQYQPAYRDPIGRTIEIEIRKVF